MIRAIFLAGFIALIAGVIPPPATSQELGLRAGLVQYDARFSGKGNGIILGAFRTIPLGDYLVLEGSLPLFLSTGQRTEDDIVHDDLRAFLPDIQLQVQVPGATIRPYAGLGVGVAIPLTESGFNFAPTASASLGLRLQVPALVIGAEVRARAFRKSQDSFIREQTRDFTIGAGWFVGKH